MMSKALTVARWEYLEKVKSKAFLIGLFLTPVLMIGMGVVPTLLVTQADTRTKIIGVIDPSGVVAVPLADLIASRYRLADIFALPSRGSYETWGLAVNEAMHLGVPCLVSDRVGCQRDLVQDGETGWVFPAGDAAALAAVLQAALRAPPGELRRRGRNALATVARYTYQQTSDGLLEALASLPAR